MSLTHIEKQKLERELRMQGGYVLDFTNRTFEEFFREVVGVDIYSRAYELCSGSKANRMRAFLQVATGQQLLLMFRGFVEGWNLYSNTAMSPSARQLFEQVISRLSADVPSQAYEKEDSKRRAIDAGLADRLSKRLTEVSLLPPHQRGYEFEKFLKELFDAYGLSARSSFRLTGEQIDGSFMVHSETYLLEAKWQNDLTGAEDLHAFEGKLSQKAIWSRGLFVSNSGFSNDGLDAFGKAKRLVCMDGYDFWEMFRLRCSFVEVLDAKVRRAAETGTPFVRVRDMFPS